jgi:hypothetical protein
LYAVFLGFVSHPQPLGAFKPNDCLIILVGEVRAAILFDSRWYSDSEFHQALACEHFGNNATVCRKSVINSLPPDIYVHSMVVSYPRQIIEIASFFFI